MKITKTPCTVELYNEISFINCLPTKVEIIVNCHKSVNKIVVRSPKYKPTTRYRPAHVKLIGGEDIIIDFIFIYVGTIALSEFRGEIKKLDILSSDNLQIQNCKIDHIIFASRSGLVMNMNMNIEIRNDYVKKIYSSIVDTNIQNLIIDCPNLEYLDGHCNIKKVMLYRTNLEKIQLCYNTYVLSEQPNCEELIISDNDKDIDFNYFPNIIFITMFYKIIIPPKKINTITLRDITTRDNSIYFLKCDNLYIQWNLSDYVELDMLECNSLSINVWHGEKLKELISLFNYLPRAKNILTSKCSINEDDYDKYFIGMSYRTFKKGI